MSKPLSITTVVLLFLAGLAFVWFLSKPSGLKYNGKTAEEWFAQYSYTDQSDKPADHLEAALALKNMGKPAIVYLLKEASSDGNESPLARFAYDVREALSGKSRKSRPYLSPRVIKFKAWSALRRIRPSAEMLLPLLEPTLQNPGGSNYNEAIYFLGCMGEGAERGIPYLAQSLTNSARKPIAYSMALQSLEFLGTNALPALPAIAWVLEKPFPPPRNIYTVLANLGSNSSRALPSLESKLTAATNAVERVRLAETILCIDPNRVELLNTVTEFLEADPKNWRLSIVSRLPQTGAGAKRFVPFLIKSADDSDATVANAALDALKKMSKADAIAVLKKRLGDQKIENRIQVAGAILRIDGHDTEAIPLLISLLTFQAPENAWYPYAIQQLGEISPEEKEGIALLQSFAQTSKNEEILQQAAQSLKNIRLKKEARESGFDL